MEKAVVLGTFDGLHAGHRAVISAAEGFARTAVTFRYPPKSYFTGVKELLMTEQDRVSALQNLGVEEIAMLDFEVFRDMSAQDFLKYLLNKYSPRLISCGYNYRFGRDALGDTYLLADFCRENGIHFVCCDPISKDGHPLSSTLLRERIKNGDITFATANIYGGFGFSATVRSGDHRGTLLGYPTINQIYPDVLVKPLFGVYESQVCINGCKYRSVTNIGIRPTFRTEQVTSETFIIGYSADLYGKDVDLRLLRFIRREEKFGSVEELKAAISRDVQSVIK